MPSNFTQTFDAPQTDIYVEPVKPLDVSGYIEGTAKGIAAIANARQEKQQAQEDANTLAQATDALGAIQEGEASYYQERRRIESAIAGGDAAQVEQYREQLRLLQQGKVSGVLTPIQATLQTNALLKQVTVAAPHLAKEFRALANEAKGNIRAAASEMFNDDPFAEQDKEDIKQAVSQNTTVEHVRAMNYRKAQADEAALQLQQTLSSKQVTADGAYRSLYSAVANQAPVMVDEIQQVLLSRLEQVDPQTGAKVPVSNEELTAMLSGLATQYRNNLTQAIANTQLQGGIAFTKDQRESMSQIYDQVFKNIEVQIAAAGTPENVAKQLKILNEKAQQTGVHNWLRDNADNPYIYLHAGDPATMAAFSDADIAAEGKISSYMAKNPSMSKQEVINDLIRKSSGNPQETAALIRIQQGHSTAPITEGYKNIMGGLPASTATKTEDSVAKAVTLNVYSNLSYDKRQKFTENLARGLDWSDLFKNKTLGVDIKNNPGASAIAIQKATNEAIPNLGVPGSSSEMVVDFSFPNDPIQYKAILDNPNAPMDLYMNPPGPAGDAPTVLQLKQQKLNGIYRTIRDNMGVGAAESWLKTLESRGVLNIVDARSQYSTTGGTRKATKTSSGATPGASSVTDWVDEANAPKGDSGTVSPETAGQVLDLVSKEAKAQNVDEGLVHAVAYVESLGGKMLRNPTSSARGPLHILKDTFEEVNNTKFDGALNWDDVKDQTKAGVAYLKDLNQKYDDLRLVFAAYLLGPSKVDANLARGGIEHVLNLEPPGQNMSLREYINKAMQGASRT